MIYINSEAIITIENEISEHSFSETGGILLGYYLNNDAIITHAFVARGKSIKLQSLFKKDLSHSIKLQDKYYKKYGTHYVGEWHKHPNNNTQYSFLDKISILISSIKNKRKMSFIIVGNDFNKNNDYISIYSLDKHDFIKDFKSWEIRNSLEDLTNEGRIRRIIRGLYDYPLYSEILKKNVAPDMEQVANALARKFSWRIQPTGDTALNYLNLSTQVMGNYIYLSNGPSKKYDILGQSIEFKHINFKEASIEHKNTSLVIQAIKAIGKNNINTAFLNKLKAKFDNEEWQKIKKYSIKAPLWIYNYISGIAK